MAMRMLEAGGLPIVSDGLRPADPANPKGYYEFEPVKNLDKQGDTAWLAGARGKAVKIISLLLTHLPESYDYRVVFMRRDLGEVVASQNQMLDGRGEQRGADDDRTSGLYAQHLEQVERFLRQRSCFAVQMVDYSAVVADPAGQAAQIARFVGGGLDVERMAAVAEPGLYRNRRAARQP